MYAQPAQSLAHTESQIAATDTGQPNLGGENIRTLDTRHGAGRINRLANSRSSIAYPNPQRIRRASHAFAQHTLPRIHNNGARLCAPSVNSQHKVAAMNLSGGHKISYLGLRLHYYLKLSTTGGKTTLATNSNLDYSQRHLIIETKRFYLHNNHF
jgi:hypothetical protein